jgi:hypothetical protein
MDASIQTYIAQSCGLALEKVQIAHINNTFVYTGNGQYGNPNENSPGLLISHDITQKVLEMLADVRNGSPRLSLLRYCAHQCLR